MNATKEELKKKAAEEIKQYADITFGIFSREPKKSSIIKSIRKLSNLDSRRSSPRLASWQQLNCSKEEINAPKNLTC